MTALIPTTPSSQSISASRIAIEPRRVRLAYDDISKSNLDRSNQNQIAFWVGLSTTFPLGEAEFIQSVMLFENQITDQDLRKAVQQFSYQEAQHSLQHKNINSEFSQCGFDTAHVERFIENLLKERAEKWSPKKRLARTVAAEHITAVMANHVLTHPQSLAPLPKTFQDLMYWHAIEEIEHKSVAFDVYRHCVGDMGYLKRHYFAFTYFEFPHKTRLIMRYLLRHQGYKSTLEDRRGMRQFLFSKEGLIRAQFKRYASFLGKDFHPWVHDDSDLVEEWKSRLEFIKSH